MLMKDIKRFALSIVLALFFFYICLSLFTHPGARSEATGSWFGSAREQWPPSDEAEARQGHRELRPSGTVIGEAHGDDDAKTAEADTKLPYPDEEYPHGEITPPSPGREDALVDQTGTYDLSPNHQEIFSLSTPDRKYFPIDFGMKQAMNPNILPHPSSDDTWIIVAQEVRKSASDGFVELSCNAVFQDGVLQCLEVPTALPIAPTPGGRCEGELEFFNLNVGPHDARVFFGPAEPYVVFGSNSIFTCFGQFIQGFTSLVDWQGKEKEGDLLFRTATELQRPPPLGTVEKNWFLFWDVNDQPYVHYDIVPQRVYAQVGPDGSVGPDLATESASMDEKCFDKYMPKPAPEQESLHQSTNSLLVTLCRRSEPSCVANDDNTFIFTIFQHKTFYNFHSVYEPYIMAFRRQPPFQVHAMSRRPLWIFGREMHAESGTSDMLYVTSMSWKNREQRYHGFIDDQVFLAFGIEDEKAGGLDVLAGDLLGELGLCSES